MGGTLAEEAAHRHTVIFSRTAPGRGGKAEGGCRAEEAAAAATKTKTAVPAAEPCVSAPGSRPGRGAAGSGYLSVGIGTELFYGRDTFQGRFAVLCSAVLGSAGQCCAVQHPRFPRQQYEAPSKAAPASPIR